MISRARLRCLWGGGRDRGTGALEYVGMIALAGLLIVAVATVLGSAGLSQSITASVRCSLSLGESCAQAGPAGDAGSEGPQAVAGGADPGPGAGGQGPEGSTDRRDTARDARGDRRDRGSGDVTQPDPSTDGPPPALGNPVPGTSAEAPDPPPWEPVDAGAGEHDSEGAGVRDQATKVLAEVGANALSGSWPAASRNLLHFLGNSGEPLEQDVDQMLDDVPEFQAQVDREADQLIRLAVNAARADGITGPVTYPVSSDWRGFGYDADNALVYDNSNWFFALGGWQSSQTGTITVYPPSESGGPLRYTSSLTVHIMDQYNWDGSKETSIGPIQVSDEQLAELHRKGLAQEFTATGQTTQPRTREGTLP